MQAPPIPADEEQRLAELDKLDLLYAPPEEAFDRITRRLAEIFQVPISTMSLIDRENQYYLSHVGLPEPVASARVMPRGVSVCSHVVAANDGVVICDLAADPRFADSPAVAAGLRFYASAPLRSDGGHPIGTLCIIDTKPRDLSPREAQLLQMIADVTMAEVKLRKTSRELGGISHRLAARQRAIDRDLNEARAVQQFLLPPPIQQGKGLVVCHTYHPFDHIGGDFVDVHLRESDDAAVLLLADVSGHGLSAALTSTMTKTTFQRLAAGVQRPYDLLTGINADLVRTVPAGRFMTALAAIYRPADCSVELSSAGHPYPILLREGATQILSTSSEIPLLIDADTQYGLSTRVDLRPGDRLLLYTDGAVEAADSAGQMLGFDGLANIIASAAEAGGADFLKRVFDRVFTFAHGKLKDDVALLSLECESS
jgi:sigma-B regulation protein RsbU (phosphoserine phosphatase)